MDNLFGQQLMLLRRSAGYSQITAAAKMRAAYPGLRMSQTHLSLLENRELPPRGKVLNKLAEFYNVPPSYFYNGESVSDNLSGKEWALIRLVRRGKYIAAIQLIVNVMRSEDDDNKIS
jgi:transcriptional regulator with XRE-family HTH domain